MNTVGSTTKRATSRAKTVKRSAAMSAMMRAARRETTKTVMVNTMKRRRGGPERMTFVRRKAYLVLAFGRTKRYLL
jgi:hypothetical protein